MAFLGDIFGGSQTKSKTSINLSSAVNALTQSIMNCSTTTNVTQEISIVGDYNIVSGVKQVQVVQLQSECANNSQNIADIQNKVTTTLVNSLKSQSQALLGILGASNADVENNIKNDVSTNITQQTISNIINTTNSNQILSIRGNNNIVKDATQEQLMKMLYKNSMQAINKLSTVQAISTKLEVDLEATQENPIEGILNSIGATLNQGSMYILFGFIVLVIAVVIMAKMMGKDIIGAMNPLNTITMLK